MRKKLLLCAVLCVAAIVLCVWLAGRPNEPVLREGMTTGEFGDATGCYHPVNFPDGRPSQQIDKDHIIRLYLTEPDRWGRRTRYRVRLRYDPQALDSWRVDSWEQESAPNYYVRWVNW
jgi:hypothetical protein